MNSILPREINRHVFLKAEKYSSIYMRESLKTGNSEIASRKIE